MKWQRIDYIEAGALAILVLSFLILLGSVAIVVLVGGECL